MPAQLVALRGQHVGQNFVLDNQPLSIGRTPDNRIIVDSLMASRRHAEIRKELSGFVLYDLRSANGTRVNGAPVTTHTLRTGDIVEIGEETLRFELSAESSSISGEWTTPNAISRPDLPQVTPAAPRELPMKTGILVGVRGVFAAQRMAIGNNPITMGRTPENTVILQSGYASRKHIEIRTDPQGYSVRDLNSSNGTLVNGRKITQHILRPGDVIEIGDDVFRFEYGSGLGPTLPPISQVSASQAGFRGNNAVTATDHRVPTNSPGVASPFSPPTITPLQQQAKPVEQPVVAPVIVAPPQQPDLRQIAASLKLQCPSCKRSVEARYEDCPWCGGSTRQRTYDVLTSKKPNDLPNSS